jgi:hypothetical protein
MKSWFGLESIICFPDKCQCEAAGEGIIRQPSSFWSSWAYLLAGIFLYRYLKNKSLELKMWTGVCFLLGITSMLGHASFTKLALAMDFASIVLVLIFFSILNFFMLLQIRLTHMLICFAGFYVVLVLAMHSMGKWGQIGICVIVMALSVNDILRETGKDFFKYKSLNYALLILSISFVIFVMDENHVMCDPQSLWQWHSFWHIGTAIAMFFYGKWRLSEIQTGATRN